MDRMEITYKKITEVIPYENNPRKNEKAVAKVAESISQFGFRVPITVDPSGVIVTGHTRLKAAIRLGLTEVPVIILDGLTEDQIKAFRLVDNKTSEYAEWDVKALAIELKDLEIDLSIFDFEMPAVEGQAFEDEYIVQIPKAPKSAIGDIYELGNHRIMCGDATSEEDLAELLDGRLIDLVITDPPYNVDYGGKVEYVTKAGYFSQVRDIINDKMPDSEFLEFLTQAFYNFKKHLKAGGGVLHLACFLKHGRF